LAFEHGSQGPDKKAEIETHRCMLDVPDVEVEPLGPTEGVASRDLGEAGDAGSNAVASPVSVGIERKVLHEQRARSDETHLAAQHVEQFGQFVDGGRA